LLGGQLKDQRIALDSKIAFAFYISKDNVSNLNYTLVSDKNVVLKTSTMSTASKGVYLCQLDLTGLDLSSVNYLKIGYGGANFEQIILRPVFNSLYTPSHLYYQNNNGVFITATLFGEKVVMYGHEKEEYQLSDDSFKTFEVKTATSIKINTGHLYREQLQLIKNINESLQVYLLFEGNYKLVQITSNKSIGETSGQFIYDDTIEFSFENNTPATNADKFFEI